MEYAACNVVYIDRAASEDRLVKRSDATLTPVTSNGQNKAADDGTVQRNSSSVTEENIRMLLGMFTEVHICATGKSCISKLSELNQSSIVELIPTLVLVDIPHEDQLQVRPPRDMRTPSPSSKQQADGFLDDPAVTEAYGVNLLQWIVSEIQYQSLSKLIVPIALVTPPDNNSLTVTPRGRTESRTEGYLDYDPFGSSSKRRRSSGIPLDQVRTMKYLDVGAVDVLTSPLLQDRLPSLAAHAYRAHKDASKEQRALLELKRGRKRSWVGVDDQKPYAYLREAMVSGLMDGICKLGGDDEPIGYVRITVALDRREKIASAIGSWQFSAHDFTDDELLHAALLMLQHALAMPELEKWRISTENLTAFLYASRSAYNAFVPYHNFRHVIDVLQATFYFLLQLGRLPPYPNSSSTPSSKIPPSPIATLLRPFEALTLLITAIGHDVGHPGVNNAFLVALNAPLAQLYNDRSVLESFHCAAYSQILRRHWPSAFLEPNMRKLMINSILATDMQLHFDYMKKLGWLQEKLHENGGIDGWNGRIIEDQRTLACSLLIKCADISNVVRKYDVAAQWTMILTDEFSRQATMEQDLGIPTALFAAPVREIIELGKSQISFMNMFALPLFQGVTDIMPAMGFSVDELQRNKLFWTEKVAEEQARKRQDSGDSSTTEGTFSPRTMSVAGSFDAAAQKPSHAFPAEVDLRIKSLLQSNPFTPANGTLKEETPQSLPKISTSSAADNSSERSIATANGYGVQDQKDKATEIIANGKAKEEGTAPRASGFMLPSGWDGNGGPPIPSSVFAEQVVLPREPEQVPKAESSDKQRSSDGTEGSSSATGDWASQATSATTPKMPLSPSTRGTSVTSRDSNEKTSFGQTPTGSPSGGGYRPRSLVAPDAGEYHNTSDQQLEGKGVMVMEKVRSLRKKPSRFRMEKLNFWKRSKSASPPVPVPDPSRIHRRAGSEDQPAPRPTRPC